MTPLAPDEVRVIAAGLDPGAARLHALSELLATDERARAERFVFELHRRRFSAARGLLREVLGALLGVAPASLRFQYGPHGKPRLAGSWLSFNVSHSGERALVAIARERELGVDIEAVRGDVEHEAIARRFFAPGEQRALASLPEHARARAFFEVWTRKEAYVKLLGGGLAEGLQGFEVGLGAPARLLAPSRADITLCALPAPSGFCAALAFGGGAARVSAVELGAGERPAREPSPKPAPML